MDIFYKNRTPSKNKKKLNKKEDSENEGEGHADLINELEDLINL
jgi:hypothetical protein